MTIVALGMVLGSGMLHAIWNLLAKRSGSQMAFLWWAQWVAAFVFIPIALLFEWHRIPTTGKALVYLGISMGLHGLYMVLLALAYKAGDLSLVYPIMRGTGTILIPVLGVFVLGEQLSALDIAGIATIGCGIILLGGWRPKRRSKQYREDETVNGRNHRRALVLAITVGLIITAYTFTDKLALQEGGWPPLTLNAMSNVGNGLCLTWFAVRSGQLRSEWSGNTINWILGGLFASGGYTLFLYAMQLAPVSQLAPMREIGTVFGTVLGVLILREVQGRNRLIASLLITAGVIAVGW